MASIRADICSRLSVVRLVRTVRRASLPDLRLCKTFNARHSRGRLRQD